VAARDARLTIGAVSKALLWLVYAWLIIDLVLLFLAFVLRLFGANPNAGFTEWVYRSVQRAMAPFRGIFEPIPLNDQSVLDTSLLFAMIVYGIVALFIRAGIDWISERLARRRWQLDQEAWHAQALAQAGMPPVAPVPSYEQVAPTPQPGSFAGPAAVVPAQPDPTFPRDVPPPR
jgi:hypothetical protein